MNLDAPLASDLPSPSDLPFPERTPTARALPTPPSPSSGRSIIWVLGGVLLPLIAFGFDHSMRVDPLIWGGTLGGLMTAQGPDVLTLRALVVYAFLGFSLAGLLSLPLTRRSRVGTAFCLTALGAGVALALVHSLLFLPLLPFSLVAAIVLFGFLGLSPYVALAVYLDAYAFAVRRQALLSRGRLRWVAAPLVLTLLSLGAGLAPLEQQRRALEVLEGGSADDVSRGMRELGVLLPLSRGDLLARYPELSGEGQLRLRNLYLEQFGHDLSLGFRRGRD